MLHRAFGLILSSEVELQGVPFADVSATPDVAIRIGSIPNCGFLTPFFETQHLNADGTSTLRVSKTPDGSLHFYYGDGTLFLIGCSGSEVWMSWPESLTLEDACTYLLGPIAGFLLRLRGVVSLHASGVIVGGVAIALVGQAGAGKSTMAAMFAQCGYSVITDDVFTLRPCRHRFLVDPGYATLRLWPESVAALCGSPTALPLITPNWDKRYLDLRGDGLQFAAERTPLAAIYILNDRLGDGDAPKISPEPEPFLALLANTYCNYLLDGPARAHEFDVLSRVVNSTAVQRVTPHIDAARLPELCRMIAADVQARMP